MKKSEDSEKHENEVCLFAATNFRSQMRRFGIKTDDRRRHMYIVGKTGMGKSTMMENMLLHDIYKGHGVGLVDPHGDFAEKIIDFIPSWRINDVVYFNPADVDYPIGFNILEVKDEKQKHLIASGLMGVFKKIWPDVWSSRMEYILNNTLLALLDYPGSTLLGINRLLSDDKYRKRVITKLTDPVVKAFWQIEFAGYSEKYATEAVAPIQNKIGQFLSASVIRNMVSQVKSTIDVRGLMDSGKILIMNLSKGRIGEDNSRLLGGMVITKIQLAAMERVDIPEEERKDFFLYVDEFQNFATPSFANILSEARKYRLGLIMAHQYVAQLDEVVADAVFGNVGTIVTFRVGGGDAEMLAKEFAPTFIEEDIVSLGKYNVFLKLMIDGVASQPFSATTLPPVANRTGSAERVIQVSRERYARTRADVEDKIMRWSMSSLDSGSDSDEGESEPTPKKEKSSKPPAGFRRSDIAEKGQAEPEKTQEFVADELSIGDIKKEDDKERLAEKVIEPSVELHPSDTVEVRPAESEKTQEFVVDELSIGEIKKEDGEVRPEENITETSIPASERIGESEMSPDKTKKKRKRKRKKKSKENQDAKSEQTS